MLELDAYGSVTSISDFDHGSRALCGVGEVKKKCLRVFEVG